VPSTSPEHPANDSELAALRGEGTLRRLVLLVLGIVVVAVLGNLAWSLHAARQNVLERAGNSARNLATALEQHTGRSIDGVELALKMVAERLRRTPPPAPAAVDATMSQVLANLPAVRAIWVVAPDGTMTHDSQKLPGRWNLADRAYFQVHRDRAVQGLFIDKPVLSKHGVWFIPVSRRLEDAGGRFAGVIVAAIEPEYLEAFYGSLQVGREGVVALVRTDGVLLHRSPAARNRLGTPLGPQARLLDHLRRSDDGMYFTTSVIDAAPRLFAYRRVPDRPLVVVVGLGSDEAFAAWRGLALGYVLASAALLALVCGLGAWLLHALAERRLAQHRADRLHRVQRVLGSINAMLVRAHGREALFESACAIAVEQGGFGAAWIELYDASAGALSPASACGRDAAAIAPPSGPLAIDDPAHWPQVVAAVREGRVRHDNDFAGAAAGRAARAAALGYRAMVALPLHCRGRLVGAMTMLAREPGTFDAAELQLLEEIAGDVSFALDHIAVKERVDYLALYDVLTGLPNRTLLAERMHEVLARSARGHPCALALVDLDRFHAINDTLGWSGGDVLLKAVAGRLRHVLGEDAVLSRLERDRFAFLLGRHDAQELALDARGVLRACFDEPFSVAGHVLRVAARMGLALHPDDGADPATLLRNAESALARGRASSERLAFYAPEMNASVAESLVLENRLRGALGRGDFDLHYQPRFEARGGALVGLEGLLRWRDAELGDLSPAQFIPVLEDTGMIHEVGRWAMARAVSDHARWRDAGLAPPRVSVNVSALQLHDAGFVDAVRGVIGGDAAHGLDIEVTESMLMTHVDSSAAKLAALRALGVSIAVDDFGTGYSSLQYLARLPLDLLKIDRSFVVRMLDSQVDRDIVASVVSLAHRLRLRVVAEGVDDEAQVEALRALGCDELQGFLFSPPVAVAQVERWLRGQPPAGPRCSTSLGS